MTKASCNFAKAWIHPFLQEVVVREIAELEAELEEEEELVEEEEASKLTANVGFSR